MTISINGTSGIVNDATDLNYTGTLTGGTGVVNLGSGQLVKDASGNLGLGVTPSASSACTNIELPYGATLSSRSNTAAPQFAMMSNAVGNWYAPTYKINGYATQYTQQGFDGTHKWYTAPSGTAGNPISFTQAMTLDASGNLLVGTTSTLSGNTFAGLNGNAAATFKAPSTASYSLVYFNNGSYVGSIVTNGSTTSYVTSSDYRLKNTIAPMTGALAKVAMLKPVTYKWNVNGADGQGFIAHELAEVEPGCVIGEKDAVDSEGNPQYQGIDTSFLVATLTAAIQEQQTLITALTARITALEQA